MNSIISLCLAIMLAIVVSTVVKLCVINRADRLRYLKNFKKGRFALIYIAAIPLYWVGIVYSGKPVGLALLTAAKACVELVVLKYDYSNIIGLMTDNLLYRITMDICFVLVAVNAILFTVTLFGQSIYNAAYKFKAVNMSQKVVFIVGDNENNRQIVKSVVKQGNRALLLAELSEDVADFVFVHRGALIKFGKEDNLSNLLSKMFKNFNDKEVDIIINTHDDSLNLVYTQQVNSLIQSTNLDNYSIDNTKGLNCYVFGEPENSSSFLHFAEKSRGCIRYINKYRLISMDFVGKYPITQFMTQSQIDYSTATVKDDVTINVAMIGFGKTNQQNFLTMVANNQLMTLRNGSLTEKLINYQIFDKKDSKNDKNLNHNYFRYFNEMPRNKSDYLPLPQKIANENFFELDINDTKFYHTMHESLSAGTRQYNYIIIAFGTDMENLDLAGKLTTKLQEWNLHGQTKVFVKIRDSQLSEKVVRNELSIDSCFIPFGDEGKVVYSIDQIVAEEKELMSRNRHLNYATTDDMSADEQKKAKENALKSWFALSQTQRESNIYAYLSIKMKLHLLGFDYCPTSSATPCASESFQLAYERGNEIVFDQDKMVGGRKIIKYTNDMPTHNVRYNLAVQEHQRWNAYMITCGFIPSSIKQIEAGKNKNMPLRMHGNITTFDGLVQFRKIMAKLRNTSEEQEDVIRYDYQVMDYLVWMLDGIGQKIVKREE